MNSAMGTLSKKASSGLLPLPSGSGLSRDLSDPCNPMLTYAQKPRTEAEEKSCSSHSRANEAVK
jgi:hypothetical protein